MDPNPAVSSPLAVQTQKVAEGSYEHRLILQLPAGPPLVIERVRSERRVPNALDVQALFIRAAEVQA